MIIYLFGPDTFRSRRKLNEIKQKFINEVDKSALNIQRFDGANLDLAELDQAIFTPPFLAKKRLVIVEELIAKNRGQKLQKEVLQILDKNLPEETVIVFWESGDKQTKSKTKLGASRSKLLDTRLRQEKFAQEFKLLTPAEVYQFTTSEVSARRGKINRAAAQLLSSLVGTDLWLLNSEINKLLAFAKNQEITDKDVATLTKTKLDEDVFKLTDALGQKNKVLALKLISHQLKSGTAPLELLSKITWQYKNLLMVKSFVEENGSGYADSGLAYQLGLHPFVVRKTMSQLQGYDLVSLKKIYDSLTQIDFKLKTSQADPETLFDLLVVKS